MGFVNLKRMEHISRKARKNKESPLKPGDSPIRFHAVIHSSEKTIRTGL